MTKTIYDSNRAWDLLFIGAIIVIMAFFAEFYIDLYLYSYHGFRFYPFGYASDQRTQLYFANLEIDGLIHLVRWLIFLGAGLLIMFQFPKGQNKLRMKKHLKYAILMIGMTFVYYLVLLPFLWGEMSFGWSNLILLGVMAYLFLRLRRLRRNW